MLNQTIKIQFFVDSNRGPLYTQTNRPNTLLFPFWGSARETYTKKQNCKLLVQLLAPVSSSAPTPAIFHQVNTIKNITET